MLLILLLSALVIKAGWIKTAPVFYDLFSVPLLFLVCKLFWKQIRLEGRPLKFTLFLSFTSILGQIVRFCSLKFDCFTNIHFRIPIDTLNPPISPFICSLVKSATVKPTFQARPADLTRSGPRRPCPRPKTLSVVPLWYQILKGMSIDELCSVRSSIEIHSVLVLSSVPSNELTAVRM